MLRDGKPVRMAITTGLDDDSFTQVVKGDLKAGDRVVAKNGQAEVRYADGCAVSLTANGMLTVGAASPCATGAGLVSAAQGSTGQMDMLSSGAVQAVGAFLLATVLVVGVAEADDEDIVSP